VRGYIAAFALAGGLMMLWAAIVSIQTADINIFTLT
jgi:hypothetical protein